MSELLSTLGTHLQYDSSRVIAKDNMHMTMQSESECHLCAQRAIS